MNLPRIAITSGEPAGIGPDIIIDALQHQYSADIKVFADADLLRQRAQLLGVECKIDSARNVNKSVPHQSGQIQVLDVPCKHTVCAGKLNPANSEQVIECIRQATDGCLNDEFDAIVTAPVHKAVINDAGMPFTGHSEWIAERCKSPLPVMMLTDASLRVCLATIHMPLSAVPAAITFDSLTDILNIMDNDLRRLTGLERPSIGVCGLNPHAGENGYLGTEEIAIITPVINALKQRGINLSGPYPADTIFTADNLKQFDAVLAMYHDQGLPVIKHQGFGKVVNVTLGLPIIRTSVDHGTALPLAGSGKADASSLRSAIEMAIEFSITAR